MPAAMATPCARTRAYAREGWDEPTLASDEAPEIAFGCGIELIAVAVEGLEVLDPIDAVLADVARDHAARPLGGEAVEAEAVGAFLAEVEGDDARLARRRLGDDLPIFLAGEVDDHPGALGAKIGGEGLGHPVAPMGIEALRLRRPA